MIQLGIQDFPALAARLRRPYHAAYYAMYSSVYGGIVTDPALMVVPVDDHMVHRGDGIFEVFKCVHGSLYNLEAHLKRLETAVQALRFTLPAPIPEIREIVIETLRAGGHRDCYVHLYISRGPGSFGVNPYDCPASQLYVTVTQLKKPFMEEHPEGARVRTSTVAVKPAFYAGVKSCNYLPNVLMKMEAEELGIDFVVAFDDQGFLAEGATENFGIVTRDRELLFPRLDRVLAGTTMLRVAELAQALVTTGELKRVAMENIPRQGVLNAAEMLIVGTTPNVTLVREFDGRPVSGGGPGPVFRRLSDLLLKDIASNPDRLTPVFV